MITSAIERQILVAGAAAGGGITSLTGDVTAIGPGASAATLANSGVTAASKGSASRTPVITVDAKGRVTVLSDALISQTPIVSIITSTGNIDDLNFSNADVIWMNNATDSTIRGLVAGVDGQKVTVHSKGAGHVFFAPQNTNSSANNRLINSVTIGTTPIAAGVGSAVFIYDGTTQRWRLDQHNQGAAITPTFSAADYFASGVTTTWTVAAGDVTNFSYYLTGNLLSISFNIATSTITSTSTTQLNRTLPNGFQCFKGTQIIVIVVDNGTLKSGKVRCAASATSMDWFNDVVTATAWANSTDNTGMVGYIPISLI